MDLNNLAFFNVAGRQMKYLAERQKVLAGNIANANTPGYIPQDLKAPNFSETLKSSVAMSVTNEKHMSSSSSNGKGSIYTPKVDTALTIDGNGVVLEDQLNEASKTSSDYNRAVTIYTNYKNLLKAASSRISG